MVASFVTRRRWSALEATIQSRWLGLGLAGMTLVALVMSALEWALGLHPGLNLAFACALLVLLTWSAFGLRAAAGEPGLVRWRRLLELADVRGSLAGVEIDVREHPWPALADLAPDAHLIVVDPHRHVGLPLPPASCDAVVLGPRANALDEASRGTLLDDALRVLRAGGHLVLVLPCDQRRGWLWIGPLEWQPGCPPGWWSAAVGERFGEVRYAPLTRRLDVLLATRIDAA
jgi:hypothetical protein